MHRRKASYLFVVLIFFHNFLLFCNKLIQECSKHFNVLSGLGFPLYFIYFFRHCCYIVSSGQTALISYILHYSLKALLVWGLWSCVFKITMSVHYFTITIKDKKRWVVSDAVEARIVSILFSGLRFPFLLGITWKRCCLSAQEVTGDGQSCSLCDAVQECRRKGAKTRGGY